MNQKKLPLSQLPGPVAEVFAGRNQKIAEALGKNPPLPKSYDLPCLYEGPVTESCKTCGGAAAEQKHVRMCNHPDPHADQDVCTRTTISPKVLGCNACQDRRLPTDPESIFARFDAAVLSSGPPGFRFNASLCEWKERLWMAYRTGWAGSEIAVVELSSRMIPIGVPKKLEISHPDCHYGREDPRLFVFGGKLHCSFIGVVGKTKIERGSTPVSHTNQMYARLDPDLAVEKVFHPQHPRRQGWEKNWAFFESDGRLLAVYKTAPNHEIVQIDGDVVIPSYSPPNDLRWGGGERRGGATPIKVGDEWWCFAHDRIEISRHRVYRTYLYTFADRHPYRPLRHVPTPLLSANPSTKPADQYASVVFPGGAVLSDGWWYVAHGVHDRHIEIHRWRHEDLERRLVKG